MPHTGSRMPSLRGWLLRASPPSLAAPSECAAAFTPPPPEWSAAAEQQPGCVNTLACAMRGSSRLETDTLPGYIAGMRKGIKASCAKRLSRIEGQVRGIARMVDEDRYCIDIVTQVSAVRAALNRVEEQILRHHVPPCLKHPITSTT